jgi:DNA-binding transcriptional LysR family regulator
MEESNPMNINYVRYALEISHCGSINRAAKQLYISQSSLSRGIKELEEEIGIRIFERSNSGITLTHQGEEFLKHASRLETQYKLLEELYFTGYKPDVFYLSVTSVRFAVACRAIINLYNQHIGEEFQNVCFEEGSLEDVVEHVYDGLFSLGILITPTDKRDYWHATAISHDFTYTVLNTQLACAFFGEQHPLAKEEFVTPMQLLEYPHATLAQSDVAPTNYCSGVNNYDYRTTARRILVSDRAALYDFLRSTNSYYIGLRLGNNSKCTHGIRFVPIANPEVKMDCTLIHMKQHRLTAIEEDFVKELKRLMQS